MPRHPRLPKLWIRGSAQYSCWPVRSNFAARLCSNSNNSTTKFCAPRATADSTDFGSAEVAFREDPVGTPVGPENARTATTVSKTPQVRRMPPLKLPASVRPQMRREKNFVTRFVEFPNGRVHDSSCVSGGRNKLSQSVSQLFHGPAPRSPYILSGAAEPRAGLRVEDVVFANPCANHTRPPPPTAERR